jgi:hypothetical protein
MQRAIYDIEKRRFDLGRLMALLPSEIEQLAAEGDLRIVDYRLSRGEGQILTYVGRLDGRRPGRIIEVKVALELGVASSPDHDEPEKAGESVAVISLNLYEKLSGDGPGFLMVTLLGLVQKNETLLKHIAVPADGAAVFRLLAAMEASGHTQGFHATVARLASGYVG